MESAASMRRRTRREKTPRPLSAKTVRSIAGVVSSAFHAQTRVPFLIHCGTPIFAFGLWGMYAMQMWCVTSGCSGLICTD